MEDLMKVVKEHRGVRDSTISIYTRYLNLLSNEITGKDYSYVFSLSPEEFGLKKRIT